MAQLSLADVISHLQSSYLKTQVLKALQKQKVLSPHQPSIREASAQCVFDIIMNLYDAKSSSQDNIRRISSGLDMAISQLEQMQRDILKPNSLSEQQAILE